MIEKIETIRDLLESQVKRNANRLSRNLLSRLEDLKAMQEIQLEKALVNIPKEYHRIIISSVSLDDETLKLLRKRILDDSNDYIRDILSDVDSFKVEFRFK